MANIKILIIDEDAQYLNSLLNYLAKNLPHHYNLKGYSDLEVIKKELVTQVKEEKCLIIIDENLRKLLTSDFLITPLVLSTKPKKETIHKFTSGKSILHKITNRLKEIDEFSLLTKQSQSSLSIGFYSPIGGVGVSNLSLISCILLSQKNISTLFISLDVNSGLELILAQDPNNSLSKYFYYYLSEPKLLIKKLKKNIKTYKGLSYISSFDSVIDYEEVTGEHLIGFFKLLKKELNYDRIIVDFPSVLNQRNISLMQYMNRFVLVSQGRKSDDCKLSHLKKDLVKYDAEDIFHSNNSIMILNQVRDMRIKNREQKNPFGLEEKIIAYRDDLIIKESTDVSYKISSQFKYVLEKAFEDKPGGDDGSY